VFVAHRSGVYRERRLGVTSPTTELDANDRFSLRYLFGGLKNVVLAKDVVVEEESPILDEQTNAGVLVPEAMMTPSSFSERRIRASRSQLRPPIPAAAWGGIGLSGGRYV